MTQFRKYNLAAWLVLLMLITTGCRPWAHRVERFQEEIWTQCDRAEQLTQQVAHVLSCGSIDSLTQLKLDKSGFYFIVFNEKGLYYWSDNWLAISQLQMAGYDQWGYEHFDNAHCLCRWTASKQYAILTIIPLRYSYPFVNEELHNTFFPAFANIGEQTKISQIADSTGTAIYAKGGKYLFSISPCTDKEQDKVLPTRIADSFSYNSLLSPANGQQQYIAQSRTRRYFWLCLLLFAIYLSYAIYIIYKQRHLHNARLYQRFQLLFATVLLVSFVAIFTMSVRFVRQSYETRQRNELQRKTTYIQKSLQELYFWNQSLSFYNTASLNVDLKDLSFTYETDIHAYDMQGYAIGTSQPPLFQNSLLTRRMASKPFFAKDPTMTQKEHIGDLEYLCSYTSFYNGDYVQIGYIAVPLFISANEVAAEVDALLSRLLPIYLIIILIAIIVSMLASKQFTAPMQLIGERMNQLQIGRRNKKISYGQHDEFGQLVDKYNRMVDELERSADLLAKSEREGAWKTMARQIAHEINNPLTPMKLTIQQLQRTHKMGGEAFDAYFDKSTTLLIEQIDNLSHIAGSFSAFAKLPAPCLAPVDVAAKMRMVAALFTQNTENVAIECLGIDTPHMAMADPELLTQVFNNLLKNALQAIGEQSNGHVLISLSDDGHYTSINVKDNGSGIPADIRDKIFVPNFTTKNTGTGLGLAICKNIVESCGGKIGFTSSSTGTTFTIELRTATQNAE